MSSALYSQKKSWCAGCWKSQCWLNTVSSLFCKQNNHV